MTQGPAQSKPKGKSGAAVLAVLAAVAFKFKAFGFSLLTMIASIGVFGMAFGLPYALGLVLVILIHESGHWIWMKLAGYKPKLPIFIPGLGAYVAMTQMPATEAMHAWVAMAGPLIGGVGCAIMFLIGTHTRNGWLMASAQTGFWINLIQLMPAKPFDGGFVISAISKWFLIPGTILLFGVGLLTGSPLIFIIAVMSLLSLRKPKVVASVTVPANPTISENPTISANSTFPEHSTETENIKADENATSIESAKATATPQPYQPLPATRWERFAIASAYLSLIVVLVVCNLISTMDVEALTHK